MNNNISKPIICIETGTVYKSATHAQKELGIIAGNIRECCRGLRKRAGGYRWKEVDCIEAFIPDGFVLLDGIPNHYINRKGDIFSTHQYKILKQRKRNDRGYTDIRLNVNGEKKTYKIHRLVAQTFIPNPNNFNEINHKDENKQNNCVDNLEWCNRSYNLSYGTVQKRIQQTKKQNQRIMRLKDGKQIDA